jgi:DNA-3-methyladenine glycosylase I
MPKERKRCEWPTEDPRMIAYHDEEWGLPLHDERKLFEFLILEGMQAGLSWSTVLNKRDNFRKAFQNFDAAKIARYGQRHIQRLLHDPGIIRNRLKIQGAINNAQRFLEVQEAFGSFDAYIWRFVGGKPIQHRFKSLSEVPATSPEADALSKDLKQRGFKFVGPTIMYAHMQATGMVNDHTVSCFRYKQVQAMR